MIFDQRIRGWWFSDLHDLPAGYMEIPGTAGIDPDCGPGRLASYRPFLWAALRAWGFLTVLFAETLEDDARHPFAVDRRFSRSVKPPGVCQPGGGRPAASTSQGLCETTLTERFAFDDCVCGTYPENMGPCRTFLPGLDGRCAYCDHRLGCHSAIAERFSTED